MPRKAVAHEQDYAVSEGPVRLTVVVGDRQYGSSMVFLDDEPVANGDIEELPLGGLELAGRTATVYTIVTDVSDATDDLSVTWMLTGGRKRAVATEKAPASKKFGSQMFKGTFHFKQ
ncbi:MAG TPA: hypothetical protein VFT21_04640 [Gemmatimonadaceae bacterium]|nr:hypothetical protein [Gemmatimonadaceae bacterium]